MKSQHDDRVELSVTHRYQFSASHRLHSNALSDELNQSIYGKCNNPHGHGHNYVLEITLRGVPDKATGLLANRDTVNELVRTKVLKLFDQRNINKDVPAFVSRVPTTENVALVIAEILGQAFQEAVGPGGVRLARVHVQETDRNGFEVLLKTERAVNGDAMVLAEASV